MKMLKMKMLKMKIGLKIQVSKSKQLTTDCALILLIGMACRGTFATYHIRSRPHNHQ